MSTAKNRIKKLKLDEVSLVKSPANDSARVTLVKSRDGAQNSPADPEMVRLRKQVDDLTYALGEHEMDYAKLQAQIDEAANAIESLQKSVTEKDAKIAELTKSLEDAKQTPVDPAAAEEALLKSASPAMRAILQKGLDAQKQVELLQKAADERDAIEKARSEGLADPDKIGPALARVAKGQSTKEDAELITVGLKAAAAIVKAGSKGLFGPVGKGAGPNDGKSAAEEAKERAAELRKSRPTLTEAQAMAEVIKGDNALYVRMNAEAAAAR